MFEKSRTIIRIDGLNCFLDLQEAFNLDGKVCFNFRQYDKTKKKGSRITRSIDCYMKLEEFAYFCEIMKTGQAKRMAEIKKKEAGTSYPSPAYVNYGGTNKAGHPIMSKKLQIEAGMKTPLLLSALKGPGKVGPQGQIIPTYLDKDAEKIRIPLSEDAIIKIGIAGERAIRYYDIWSANDILEDKIKIMMSYGHSSQNEGIEERSNNVYSLKQNSSPEKASAPIEQRY